MRMKECLEGTGVYAEYGDGTDCILDVLYFVYIC